MTQIENEVLPRALMIGVDYDLFWTLTPKSLSPFIRAFELRKDHEDGVAWLNGLYIRLAISSSMNKESKYPEQPFSTTEKVVDIKVSKMNRIKQIMMERMNIINKQFTKEEDVSSE